MGGTIQDVGDLVYSLKVETQGISGKARIAEVNGAGRRDITPSLYCIKIKIEFQAVQQVRAHETLSMKRTRHGG